MKTIPSLLLRSPVVCLGFGSRHLPRHTRRFAPIKSLRSSLFAAVLGTFTAIAPADEVTDWNQIMLQSLRTGGVAGAPATRPAATVQAAVFDAFNGIEQRYGWIHVQPAAPPGASRRAAVVQAAYASLVQLFPAQKLDLDGKRANSLAAIASSDAAESSRSIALGIQWGQVVANAIVAWRAADGFTPPLPPIVLAAASSAFVHEAAAASGDILQPFGGNVHARVDMSRTDLVAQLGEPSEKFGEAVWAYWDFRRVAPPASARGDALVVVFVGDRVSLLRLTTRSSVETALRQMRANAAQPATIARR